MTHLHLVSFAYAILTPLRIAQQGTQGQRTRRKAADGSTAAVQDQLRKLFWDELLLYLQEEEHSESALAELE